MTAKDTAGGVISSIIHGHSRCDNTDCDEDDDGAAADAADAADSGDDFDATGDNMVLEFVHVEGSQACSRRRATQVASISASDLDFSVHLSLTDQAEG